MSESGGSSLEVCSLLLKAVVILLVLKGCRIMVVDGRCIHDILQTNRGTSPQQYAQNFQLKDRSEWKVRKYQTAGPLPTSSTQLKYTRIGYHVRYKRVRHRTTPGNELRHKRFVEEGTNSTKSNSSDQLKDKGSTRTSSPPSGQDGKTGGLTDTGLHESRYQNDTGSSRSSAKTTFEDQFRPIRVSLFFQDENIEYSNTSEEYKRLNESLQRAVSKISDILSVIPVQGPLLFKRTAEKICNGFWSEPSDPNLQNNKRCGIEKPYYEGETCIKGEKFKIPDDHLQGYEIYENVADPDPTKVLFENGTGLKNADTVIYIHAERTAMCKDKGVIAYATFCQLDQNSRPIAGFANFCPDHLDDVLYDKDTLYLTALHEFFHALGFSKDLFDKFQECYPKPVPTADNHNKKEAEGPMDWVCEDRGKTVGFIHNRKHIITPAVTRETQMHLNCSSKRGCPLENHVVLPIRTSSHWEGTFMQGSLMSPTIGLPHLTVVDRITLGAFEDMGWYKVNYSHAEDLAWGRHAGCDFATGNQCFRSGSPYFCNQYSIKSGCHFLHLDKGTCETNQYLDSCRVYKAHARQECWRSWNKTRLTEWKGEVYSRQSRCFISNLASESSEYTPIGLRNLEGRCYVHRCNDSNTLEVRVEGSDWRLCHEGAEIRFNGYQGHLKCPSAAVICAYSFETTTTSAVNPTSVPTHYEPYCAKMKITFPGILRLHAQLNNKEREPELSAEAKEKIDMFLMKFVNEIVAVTDIDKTRILDIHFVSVTTVQFTLMKNFDWSTYSPKDPKSSLMPGEYNQHPHGQEERLPFSYNYVEVSCKESIRRLLVSVTKGDFKVSVNGETYKANNVSFTSPDEETKSLHELLVPPKKPTSTGTVAAAAVGAVCGTMLISVGVMLYWKSQVTTAVSPAPPSPTSTDVRYHPNNGATVAPSENGSMGQLTFTV